MFARFFDTRPVDAFAAEVARELSRSLPPGSVGDARRLQKLDGKLGRMVTQLVRAHRLNFYQKAKLGTRLQDALEQAGYPVEFSKTFSYQLVTRVAQARP
jgi:hypothetical protein